MVTTQHSTFSAAHRAEYSKTVVPVSESDTAAEQFINLLDQLLGKSSRISAPDSNLDVKPAELLYSEREVEKAPVEEKKETLELKSENQEKAKEDIKEGVVQADEEIAVETTAAAAAALLVKNEKLCVEQSDIKVEQKEGTAQVVAEGAKQVEQLASMIEVINNSSDTKINFRKTVENKALEDTTSALQNQASTGDSVKQAKIDLSNLTEESSIESAIEAILAARAELNELGHSATKSAPLKENLPQPAVSNLTAAIASQTAVSGLVGLAAKNGITPKMMGEFIRERDPAAALSLLGEKSKVQTPKETSAKGKEVNSRQEQIINQILKLIDQAAKTRDGTTLSIKVNPDQLGQVLVKVSQRGDQLFARIVPEHKEVEHTVRSNVSEVVAQLVAAGFKSENIHVSVGKELTESERFSMFHNGLAERGSQSEGNLLQNGEQKGRHGSGIGNGGGSSKAEEKDAFPQGQNAVNNGWVA